jgi:hypothetical protein
MAKKILRSGIIEDPRPEEQKQLDYRHEELAEAGAPVWQEVSQDKWRQYPIFNQDSSYSCLGQAIAKAAGIEQFLKTGKFVDYSAKDVYRQRINLGPGMYGGDGLNIVKNKGITLEQLIISQNLSESKMNDDSDATAFTAQVALDSKMKNYLTMGTPDIDKINTIVEPKGKPVAITLRFTMQEWNQPVPQVDPKATPDLGHGVCVTQAILYQGKKALLIDDSWGVGFGIVGKRIITEEWFKAGRVTWAGYFTEFSTENALDRPNYAFNRDLNYGLTANEDVKNLQKCLNYIKMFPDTINNQAGFTGNFYGITLAGVKLFQTTYKLPATGKVDQATRLKLNELFKIQ